MEQLFRDVLNRYEIVINGANNGVFLPNRNNTDGLPGVLHNGPHPKDYMDAVNNRILKAERIGGRPEVINELGRIQDILLSAERNSSWYTLL